MNEEYMKEYRKRMEASQKEYQIELREGTVEKWSKVFDKFNDFKNIESEYKAYTCYALENQRLHNELNELTPQFKRISIPMVLRVMLNLKGKGIEVKSDLRYKAKVFRTGLNLLNPSVEERFMPRHSLDKEAEETAIVSEEIVKAIANRTFAPNFYFLGITLDNHELVIYYDEE